MRDQLGVQFKELRGVSVDNLMYIKVQLLMGPCVDEPGLYYIRVDEELRHFWDLGHSAPNP